MKSKKLANIIDWYLNKLNTMRLLPTNAATVLRDMSAKQIGGLDFKPRPLTIDNFTNPELDSILRLSNNGTSSITNDSYEKLKGFVMGKVKNHLGSEETQYDHTGLSLGQYLSPARVISTTLGRAVVKKDDNGPGYHLKDVYDADMYLPDLQEVDKGYGKEYHLKGTKDGGFLRDKALERILQNRRETRNTTYGRMRGALGQYGHKTEDPESSKIKTFLSIDEIKKRLGNSAGTYDIHKPMSRDEFAMKTTGAGALTGAPIGAVLGAMSGAMMLISPKKRKKWLRTMLLHTLVGAGLTAGLGALGGNLFAKKVYDKFEKNSSDKASIKSNKKKEERNKRLDRIASALSYSFPLLALAGIAGYGASKGNNIIHSILDRPYTDDDTVHITKADNANVSNA